ncbi:PAS domain-containing protein [Nitrosomonas sp. Is37]|uniref:PAS domain-containing protein n=1 Tax=Nitrosomonas sp. Is37 TaxID=3080535 RepID=UPI00294ADD7B|nr:PAS domain-containing protein [Nitrosomonas sp. Is37]MDV6343641.1 PAS domain-containing protein [Nitrosomonas sp. Is37]
MWKNCRLRQSTNRDQEERYQLKETIENKQPIEITLRNYRKNSEMFYNYLTFTPLFDAHGNILYYLSVQYDVTQQRRAEEEIKRLTEKLATIRK